MNKNTCFFALSLIALLVMPAHAQDGISIVEVFTVSVKPGKNAQFEEVVSAFREASQKQGLENYWLSAQSVSGEPVYRFHLQRSSWGYLSNPGPQFEEVYGANEAARLMGLLHESVASEHTAFYREFENMSYLPADGFDEPPEGLIYYDFTLNAGTAPMFQEMTRAQKVASSAMYPDNYFSVSMPDFGATAGPRTILILQSFSDLDTPTMNPGRRLIEHLGQEEGARLNELAAQSIARFEVTLFRTRPDLNYQPED